MASPTEIHRQMVEAWNLRDTDKIKALLHPEYTYTGSDGREMAGPDAGLNMAQMFALAFPDGRLEVRRVFAQGNTAIAEMVGHGTHRGELMGLRPTGREIRLLICNIMELRDGMIYREREYMDMLELMVQIGAVTLPGAAARTAQP